MANYINGIQVGSKSVVSAAPYYAYGPRHMRQMLWWWLTKVVGWQDIEESGFSIGDVLTGTDGATDASDPTLFTSATGGFTSAMEDCYLLIHPSSAPATAGGFTDPTRNGLYQIRRRFDTNTISIEPLWGVLAPDPYSSPAEPGGLPLNETGLNFTVLDLHTATYLITTTDYAVIRGTGTGGTFDVRIREDYSANYAPNRFTVSPFADWSAGAPGSFSPGTRECAESQKNFQPFSDFGYVWAYADLTQVVVWTRYYNVTAAPTQQEDSFFYIGDIVPFHASSDPRPVICIDGTPNASTDYEIDATRDNVLGLAGDDTTQQTGNLIYPSAYANVATPMTGFNTTQIAQHSARYGRLPLVVTDRNAPTTNEVRGPLKNVTMGHQFGPSGPIPLGVARNRLRLTIFEIPWNGSRVNRKAHT
jgi:hypothetical protein